MKDLLTPLRNPLFRRLWLANLTSNFGGMVQAVGASWLMMTLTGSPEMVALVQTCVTFPLVAFSLLSGALADTFDRRRIMLTAQCFMLAAAGLLTALAFAGVLSPSLLLLFTFLIGCGGAMYIPSWQASLRDIMDLKDLPNAVALNSMGFNLMRSVGPAVGGAVLAFSGAAVLFLINTASYLGMIAVLLLWRPAKAEASTAREPLPSALASGLRYSSMSPNLVRVILRGATFGSCSVAMIALLPVVARDMLGGGPGLYGGLLGSFGAGAVFAAVISPTARARLSNEWIARLSFVVSGLAALILVLGGTIPAAFIALFLAGSCWVLANSLFNVIVQLSIPKWVVGRSLSILHTGVFGGMAFGSWVWGLLAEAHGTETALLTAGLCLFAGAAFGLVMHLPAIPEGGLDPLNRFREPVPRLDLSRRPGPIGIAIDYRIAQRNVPAFLAAMKRRRQVRRRDGALRWALTRDIENPEIWTESYHVRTWQDYIRHNERRTEADAADFDALWALHEGPEPPAVRRVLEWETVPSEDVTALAIADET